MSVAICFFGLTRSLSHTIVSIQTHVLNELQKNTVPYTIFLHSYAQHVIYSPRSGELNIQLNSTEWRLLNPAHVRIDPPESADAKYNASLYAKFGNPWKKEDKSLSTLRNLLRSLYSIEQCYKLVEEWELRHAHTHTYIMFIRPDVLYMTHFPAQALRKLSDKTVGVRYIDRFAIGKRSAINAWAHRMASADQFLKQQTRKIGLHSESLLQYHAAKHGLRLFELEGFCFKRLRANNKLHRSDKCPTASSK